MKCPNCKEDLVEAGIGYSAKGTILYELSLDSQGDLQWEQDQICDEGVGEFYCRSCGVKLEGFDEEIVIKILKE